MKAKLRETGDQNLLRDSLYPPNERLLLLYTFNNDFKIACVKECGSSEKRQKNRLYGKGSMTENSADCSVRCLLITQARLLKIDGC